MNSNREEALFRLALTRPAPERGAWLDRECEGDLALRQRLEALLAAQEQPDMVPATPVGSARPTIKLDFTDVPDAAAGKNAAGATIAGRYTLSEKIGEGGMGEVWVAEQSEPVKRRVALKLIKTGMDSKAVLQRFEQERQALAVMDHPNIARVFDGGLTPTGQPFFVMELVHGRPLNKFCDEAKLTPRERLELFVPICQAVQHAHQKGIVHRDLKPANILVTLIDGKPVAKVIDFGVAKAMGGKLTNETLATQLGAVIGTLEYMSPEQAGGEDIDTRADIYSLGVILYELLTGLRPISAQRLRQAALAEMLRIVQEEEPAKPSTRLSTEDSLPSLAALRQIEPRKLMTLLRGELDWVVMKCLEKQRDRRYETANGLVRDIQRYLADETVEARPPSAGYRLQKFVRRNKAQVIAAGLVLLTLVGGIVGTSLALVEAKRQERLAEARRREAVAAEAETKKRADELAKVSEFQASMLSQIDATEAGVKLMAGIKAKFAAALENIGVPEAERSARTAAFEQELVKVNATDAAAELIDRTILKPAITAVEAQFKDQPAVDAKLRHTLADLYRTLGLYPAALELQTNAVNTRRRVLGEDDPDTLSSRRSLASLLDATAKTDEAIGIMRDVLERNTRALGPDHPETLSSMSDLGNLLRSQGKFAEAEPLLRGALDRNRRVRGPSNRVTLISMNTYGQLLMVEGKFAEAEPYWREAYETGKRVLGPDDPDTLVWTHNLGGLMLELGRLQEAADRYREAAEAFRRVHGEEHPSTLTCLQSLSLALSRQGKQDEAGKILVQVLGAQRRTLGEEHPSTLNTMTQLGMNLHRQGKLAESEAILREALAARRRVLGNENMSTLDTMAVLAGTLSQQEKFAESNPLYLEQLATTKRVVGTNHPTYLAAGLQFGASLVAQGKFEQAEPYLRWAVEGRRKVSGPSHPETGFALNALGILLRDEGKPAEAETAIREAATIFRAALSKDNPSTFTAIADLAGVLVVQAKLDEAEPLCREALTGLERVAGKDSSRTAAARRTMGRLRTAQKKFDQAETELIEAHRVVSAAPEGNARSLRQSVRALADLSAAWNIAEPGKDYEARRAEWQAKLEPIAPPAPEKKP